jgi:hypothetical protein
MKRRAEMKIGIIDADLIDNGTRHPNLALMKISGYYKNKGYKVELVTKYEDVQSYDKVFVSKVFSFTEVPDWLAACPNVTLGGTGFFSDGGDSLMYEIEHHMPDYSLYNEYVELQISEGKNSNKFTDYLNYSIGFTTRGCFRKCEFCVNKKYDRATIHSPINEFLDDNKPAIYLWDDNFLAYSGWEEVLDDLEATNKPFQFRQGLDIRLLNDRSAKRLSKVKYHGDFIFAFDHIEDRDLIEKRLKLWRRYSTKTTKLYVFCAYESQDENDIINVFERIRILMRYGCLPYIMRYESYKTSKYRSIYTQLARWCNQPQFFKKKSFRQFCIANQEYHKNKETQCSAYQSMLEFEQDFPDIANEYFDLRYDEENEYTTSLGFGRKYPHKQDCDTCEVAQKTWINAVNGIIDTQTILKSYFAKELDLQCLTYKNKLCIAKAPLQIANWFCEVLLSTDIYSIIKLIAKTKDRDIVDASNIPQYSNLEDATNGVVEILVKSGEEGITFDQMGYYLNGKQRNDVANRKYGENHAKLATLLDIANINSSNTSALISSSVLGKAYYKLSTENRELILARLALRIPAIQNILIDAINGYISVDKHLSHLSIQTQKRRKPNVVAILEYIKKYSGQDMEYIFKNIEEM